MNDKFRPTKLLLYIYALFDDFVYKDCNCFLTFGNDSKDRNIFFIIIKENNRRINLYLNRKTVLLNKQTKTHVQFSI